MLFWYLILAIFFGKRNCLEENASKVDKSGSGRLLERFDKVYNGFQQLKKDLGYLRRKDKDPAAHLKASKCHFEDDCINDFFHDNTTSVFNWRKRPFINDPSIPHPRRSDRSNHFMVAKVEKHFKRNQHAILTTDVPVKTGHQCVDFYYFMYSEDGCDSVRFSVTLKCYGYPDEIIVKTSGSKKKEWHYVLFDVNKPIGTHCKIQWRAAKGLSEEGKVGIDDVSIHYESCPKNGRVFPGRLSCNFFNDNCLWQQRGILKWKPVVHATVTRTKLTDFIQKEARYVKLNNSGIDFNVNRSAILVSPLTYHRQPKCFSFEWSLQGRDPGNLTVSFHMKKKTEVVWRDNYKELKKKDELAKTKDPVWNIELIDLPRKEEYKIEIKFMSSKNPWLYASSLNSIVVLEGECEIHQDPFFTKHRFIENKMSAEQQKKNKSKEKKRKERGSGNQDPWIEYGDGINSNEVVVSTCTESYLPIICISYMFINFLKKL